MEVLFNFLITVSHVFKNRFTHTTCKGNLYSVTEWYMNYYCMLI